MDSHSSSPTFYDDASGKVTLHTHKLNAQLFSRIARFFVPCCKGRPEKVSIEKNNGSESTISCSHNNKSSDSVTVVDTNLIFPSGLQADNWIFRTGWTPQPDPLVIMQREWCSKCCRSARMESGRCTLCGA